MLQHNVGDKAKKPESDPLTDPVHDRFTIIMMALCLIGMIGYIVKFIVVTITYGY